MSFKISDIINPNAPTWSTIHNILWSKIKKDVKANGKYMVNVSFNTLW